MKSITPEEGWAAHDAVFREVLEERGITVPFRIQKLKSEFGAKITKTLKVKGALDRKKLPRGFRIIATTGTVETGPDGERVYSDGETIIQWYERDNDIRQRARMDAHKLAGDYPAEKQDIRYPDGIPLIPLDAVAQRRLEHMERLIESNGSGEAVLIEGGNHRDAEPGTDPDHG